MARRPRSPALPTAARSSSPSAAGDNWRTSMWRPRNATSSEVGAARSRGPRSEGSAAGLNRGAGGHGPEPTRHGGKARGGRESASGSAAGLRRGAGGASREGALRATSAMSVGAAAGRSTKSPTAAGGGARCGKPRSHEATSASRAKSTKPKSSKSMGSAAGCNFGALGAASTFALVAQGDVERGAGEFTASSAMFSKRRKGTMPTGSAAGRRRGAS
mmetsp:Transcript_89712/g.250865  ORF Transcript_89712/g.250865 Transcript_89712/m.250865 type:complete len:217 (+) Transcript_89712:2403-3053(+)